MKNFDIIIHIKKAELILMKRSYLLIIVTITALFVSGCQKTATATKQPLTIYLVRHGQTILNAHGRIQGWIDAPLTKEGASQATLVGQKMHALNFVAAYSADNQRTTSTARLILAGADDNVQINQLKNLREGYYGSFEGDKTSEFTNKLPKLYHLNSDAALRSRYPQTYWQHIQTAYAKLDPVHEAENSAHVVNRFDSALSKITAQHKTGNVLVVSSGMATMEWLESQHIPIKKVKMLPNNSVTKLVSNHGKLKVVYYGREMILE